MREFWRRMAPYIALVEDGHVNAPVIAELVADGLIASPVLVVGAGHGLLVAELLSRGLEVEGVDWLPAAVEGALTRRGLRLTLAEGEALPYRDERFATVIVASGVVDFLDDRDEILRIVGEAQRVTSAGGRTLVGFWRLDAEAVAFFEHIGILAAGRFRQRDAFAMGRKRPTELLGDIAGKVGFVRAVYLVAVRFLRLPPQERAQGKALADIWRTDPDPDGLLAAVPIEVPMYGEPQIGELLSPFDEHRCHAFRTCIVAELPKAVR